MGVGFLALENENQRFTLRSVNRVVTTRRLIILMDIWIEGRFLMFHVNRVWASPMKVNCESELAHKLTQMTWCLCSSFEFCGYLYLNDATHEDGALEYAVVKKVGNEFIQVESITFSWCSEGKARNYIIDITEGKYDSEGWKVVPRFDNSKNHLCDHCR